MRELESRSNCDVAAAGAAAGGAAAGARAEAFWAAAAGLAPPAAEAAGAPAAGGAAAIAAGAGPLTRPGPAAAPGLLPYARTGSDPGRSPFPPRTPITSCAALPPYTRAISGLTIVGVAASARQ